MRSPYSRYCQDHGLYEARKGRLSRIRGVDAYAAEAVVVGMGGL